MAETATATDGAGPIPRTRGIDRRFGGVKAVEEVDLEIRLRERCAILGPNGPERTTLRCAPSRSTSDMSSETASTTRS
jgi:ABC-type branched-subunit amino acid transport system ATPase component